MNCTDVRDRLSELMDGELPANDDAVVRQHLETCGECRVFYEKLSYSWRCLDEWQDVVPPESLKKNIMAGLSPKGRFWGLKSLLPVAAALILILSAVIYYSGQKSVKTAGAPGAVPARSSSVYAEVNEDEIIANLDILSDDDFLDSFDELEKLEILPFIDVDLRTNPKQSSLNRVISS